MCRRYIAMARRDTARLTTAQEFALAASDVHALTNLAALIHHGQPRHVAPAPVLSIPVQRPTPEAEHRRPVIRDPRPLLIPSQVAAEARERNRNRRKKNE